MCFCRYRYIIYANNDSIANITDTSDDLKSVGVSYLAMPFMLSTVLCCTMNIINYYGVNREGS